MLVTYAVCEDGRGEIVETDSGPFSVAALVTNAMRNAFAHRILVEETFCNVAIRKVEEN
jgi:hypothetical protein